jgi:hypothetical protein
MTDRITELERLGRLREQGVVDETEFAALKAKLLTAEPVFSSSSSWPWDAAAPAADADDRFTRGLADYERISGIAWMVFAGLQVLLGVLQIWSALSIVIGIWNMVAGWSHQRLSKRVLAREASVLKSYRGVVQLIVLGIVNLAFGAIPGVIMIGVGFYVRHKVLSNAHLFTQGASGPMVLTQT